MGILIQYLLDWEFWRLYISLFVVASALIFLRSKRIKRKLPPLQREAPDSEGKLCFIFGGNDFELKDLF